ncbi:ABC transporter permease [Nocardioides cynanchi]|uniref:ABC transporter permease n=1 Tax=Nocardioides cynanchi TaxID=2558918 RepID=UPI001248CD57|nr:ABC transporter permease [Nocardioides cynanchi]
MTGFILRRLVSSILVVILTSIFVFVLFFKGLGDSPARNYCEKLGPGKCTAQKLGSIEHQMGLDQSVAHNYAVWAEGIFAGRHDVYVDGKLYDCPAPCLGISISSGNTVWHDLEQKYPATITLAIGGSLIGLVVGVLLGAFAALWRGSATDRLLVGGSLVISAIPFYVIALLAWIYLTLQLKIFPTTGYYPVTQNPARTVAWMMLPWLVIGLTSCTQYARFTRAQVVETLAEDYIRTARSKGLPGQRVLFKHALRAAIVPVTTIFGLNFAALLAGTIFTERIFEIDGIGKWSLDALQTPIDLQVVSATVLVSAILVVLANLLVDIFYSFLDPRTSVS